MHDNTSGTNAVAIGNSALAVHTTGEGNTGVGSQALYNANGDFNVGLGRRSGATITTGTKNVMIGYDAEPSTEGAVNQIVIGSEAKGTTDNSVQLGNSSITAVNTSGALTTGAVTYPIAHGTSGQVLSTTGSGALTWTDAGSGNGAASVNDLSDAKKINNE